MKLKVAKFLDPTTQPYSVKISSDALKLALVDTTLHLNNTFHLNLGQYIKKRRQETQLSPISAFIFKSRDPTKASSITEASSTTEEATTISLEEALNNEFISYQSLLLKPVPDCLNFWKKNESDLPILSKVASIILSQPIGSFDVERRCSELGNIITKQRNRLGHEKVSKLFIIHGNHTHSWLREYPSAKVLF